jgi:hypothetical protein
MMVESSRIERPGTVLQGGRAKAFRPKPAAERGRAFEAGLAAYRRGDFFEAHELLEPAWMGTNEPVERELYQGLIKLAAAYVHEARGNPVGVAKNLAGARLRLAAVIDVADHRTRLPASARQLDIVGLVEAIDQRIAELAELERDPSGVVSGAPAL